MLANVWAVGGPTCGHTIGQVKWYMLPKGNINTCRVMNMKILSKIPSKNMNIFSYA